MNVSFGNMCWFAESMLGWCYLENFIKIMRSFSLQANFYMFPYLKKYLKYAYISPYSLLLCHGQNEKPHLIAARVGWIWWQKEELGLKNYTYICIYSRIILNFCNCCSAKNSVRRCLQKKALFQKKRKKMQMNTVSLVTNGLLDKAVCLIWLLS